MHILLRKPILALRLMRVKDWNKVAALKNITWPGFSICVLGEKLKVKSSLQVNKFGLARIPSYCALWKTENIKIKFSSCAYTKPLGTKQKVHEMTPGFFKIPSYHHTITQTWRQSQLSCPQKIKFWFHNYLQRVEST